MCVKIKSDQLNCVPFENCGTQKHMRTYAHTTCMCVPSTIPIDDSSSKLLILSDVQSDVSSSALPRASDVSSDAASSEVPSESSVMPSAIPSDVPCSEVQIGRAHV